MLLLAVPAPHHCESGCEQKPTNLPAGFAWLACVSLIVVTTASAPASTATKSLAATRSTAPRFVRLRLRFVDLQRAPAEFRSVQCRDSLIRLGCIRHLDEPETSGTPCLTVGHDADFFHRTVSLEHRSQLRLSCAVGQIPNINILHCVPLSVTRNSVTVLRSAALLRLDWLRCSRRLALRHQAL